MARSRASTRPAPGQEGSCKATWREAGPPNHHDDKVDLKPEGEIPRFETSSTCFGRSMSLKYELGRGMSLKYELGRSMGLKYELGRSMSLNYIYLVETSSTCLGR